MSATTTAPTTANVGKRVELGRYRTTHGERILIGQRVCGVVRVNDVPACGGGRRYLVERELTCKAELDALVTDHLTQAQFHSDCPMRRPALAPAEGWR
jgi:hypothetical protein